MNDIATSENSSKLTERIGPRKRLAYTFIGLFILLVVAISLLGAIFFRNLSRIEDTTTYFRDTIMPMTATAYELEINLVRSVLGVVQYLNHPQTILREKFEEVHEKFEHFLAQYSRVAQTARERALHGDMKGVYAAFTHQARTLMDFKDTCNAIFSHLQKTMGRVYRIVESDFRTPTGNLVELQEAQRLAKAIDHALNEMVIEASIQSNYGLNYNLDRLRDISFVVNVLFHELENLPTAASNDHALREMRSIADDMTTSVEQIIRLNHEISTGSGFLIDLRRHMGAILVEGIQEIAVHRLMENVDATKSAIKQAEMTFMVSIIVIFLVAATLGWIFVRQVLRPIAALTRNVEAYGRGEMSIHPNVTQRNEIGFLAEQFTAMAKSLSKSQASLSEINANLEAKVAARTAEVSAANRSLLVELEKRIHTEERLQQAVNSAIEASQAKSTFLSSMSHELRTPLNAILGFSEIMAKEMFGPLGNDRYKDYAADIQNSGGYLLQLINDLLTLGAIDEGRLKISESSCDPREITDEVMQLIRVQASAARIDMRSRLSAGLGPLYADRRHVKQILINLVVNAVKFTDDGGAVLIRWRMRQGSIELSVIDTGSGISPEELETLFNRYQRGDRSIRLQKQGIGLGLSIVKGMAEAHGARISVRSRVGHGTAMIVRFPASRTLPCGGTSAHAAVS